MIIFNDTTLFVHNPKTAGTSLISYLKAILSGSVHEAGVRQLGTYHPSLSMALGYAYAVRGHTSFDRIISVIRNPFDREVSMYVYFRDVLSTSPGLSADLPDFAMQRRVLKTKELDFRSYLRWLWDVEGTVDIWRSRCFCEAVEISDTSCVRLIRFERLDEDLSRALHIKEARIPRRNESDRKRTAEYYDQETINIVQNSYEWMFTKGYYLPDVKAG
jgi:hypothetical protein